MQTRAILIVLTLTAACGREPAVVVQAAPTVQRVGDGAVSTALPEFATTLTAAGETVYFNRTPPDRSKLELFFAERTDGVWGEARVFPPTEGMVAIDPVLSPDGRRLYFSSNQPHGDEAASFDLWYVERSGSGWGEPTPLGAPINSPSHDLFNSFTTDGTMVFGSERSGETRIYSTTLRDGEWSEPVPLTLSGVGKSEVGNPAISPDGSMLVVSVVEPEGSSDLFVACRKGSGWDALQRLPEPINSAYADFAPGFSAGQLYFTSERPGIVGAQPPSVRPPGDIYMTSPEPVRALCGSTQGAP